MSLEPPDHHARTRGAVLPQLVAIAIVACSACGPQQHACQDAANGTTSVHPRPRRRASVPTSGPLRSDEHLERAAAILGGASEDDEAIQRWALRLLQSPHELERCAAARVLANRGGSGLRELTAFLLHSDPGALGRAEAWEAVLESPSVEATLWVQAFSDVSDTGRSCAFNRLATFGTTDHSIAAAALAAVSDGDLVGTAACEAIARGVPPQEHDEIRRLAEKADGRRLLRLLTCMAHCGLDLSDEMVVRARQVARGDSSLAPDLVEALVRLNDPRAWDVASDLLCSDDISDVAAARVLRALSDIQGARDRLASVSTLALSKSPRNAAYALADVGARSTSLRIFATETLATGFGDADRARYAADALVQLGESRRSLPWAHAAARSSEASDRVGASRVLASIPGTEVDPLIWALLEDADPLVRAGTEQSLVRSDGTIRALSLDLRDHDWSAESRRAARHSLVASRRPIHSEWRFVLETPLGKVIPGRMPWIADAVGAFASASWDYSSEELDRLADRDQHLAVAAWLAGCTNESDPRRWWRGGDGDLLEFIGPTIEATGFMRPEAVRFLENFAREGSPENRIVALVALSDVRAATADVIVSACDAHDPWVRRAGYWAAASTPDAIDRMLAVSLISRGLRDGSDAVRAVAAQAAAASGYSEFAEALTLRALFGDSDDAQNVGRLGPAGVSCFVAAARGVRFRAASDGVLAGVARWIRQGGDPGELARCRSALTMLLSAATAVSTDSVSMVAVSSAIADHRVAALACASTSALRDVLARWNWRSETDDAAIVVALRRLREAVPWDQESEFIGHLRTTGSARIAESLRDFKSE